MNNESIRNRLTQYRSIAHVAFSAMNRFPLNNSFRGATVKYGLSMLKGCKIRNHGTNNVIRIGDFSRLINCTIEFHGNNNTLVIGDRCLCNEACFWMEEDNNQVLLGDHTHLSGNVQLSVLEGTSIQVGQDCLFSDGIDIRTGDSHSLVEKGTQNRLNPSESITIGEHVWVGRGVTILKGTVIADHCVIGAASLLCKKHEIPNCVLVGTPAKEVKQNIDWINDRI